MWFAAMKSVRSSPWFVHLVVKLLENQKSVTGLLKTNPFKEEAPRFIRAGLYVYRFSTPAEKKESGRIWVRDFKYEYMQPQSLNDLSSVRF